MKKINSKNIIFSNGVYLEPIKILINNKRQWRWVAIGFEESSFCCGKEVNPQEKSNTLKGLIKKFDDKS